MPGFCHLGLPKRSQDTASRCGPDWYEWIERSVQTRVGKARNFTYLIVKSISQGYRIWKLFSKTDLGMSRVTKVVKVNRYLTPSSPETLVVKLWKITIMSSTWSTATYGVIVSIYFYLFLAEFRGNCYQFCFSTSYQPIKIWRYPIKINLPGISDTIYRIWIFSWHVSTFTIKINAEVTNNVGTIFYFR